MPRGIYDRTAAKKRREMAGGVLTVSRVQRGANSDRIYWTDDELKALAEEWVLLRMQRPVESASVLMDRAQNNYFTGANAGRKRILASLAASRPLLLAVGKAWRAFHEKPPVEPPPPEIITQLVPLEITRPLTLPEMLALLDEPTLLALLRSKELERENLFHQLLAAGATKGGAVNPPKVPAFKPPTLEIFQPAKTHGPRIAILGTPEDEHKRLEDEVERLGLDVTLRFANGKDTTALGRSDFAIITRGKLASNPDSDRAVHLLGRDKVVLLEAAQAGTLGLVQAVRNLCSRK